MGSTTRNRVITTVSESLLARAWEWQALRQDRLLTGDGRRLRVVHPGRPNYDAGPDFSNAVLEMGGEVVKGDVELHLRTSQWRAHGHHRDPRFNTVVLHVVLWDDEAPTPLQSGGKAPVLAVHGCLSRPLEQLQHRVNPVQEPCRGWVERWGDQVCVGHTDLGGGLDVLASLRDTQQLLFDVVDSPDEVDRLAGEITRLWIRYYDELDAIIRTAGRGTTNWAVVLSPGRCCVLQCDFSFMTSPQMFDRFALPDLVACCEAVDHAVYHLDGAGQIRHLDMLLALERLHCIQWIPGDGAPPAEEWLPLLKRIRDGGKLCQLFYISPEGARAIVRELGGRGFAFYVRERMVEAEAQGFMQALADEDARH